MKRFWRLAISLGCVGVLCGMVWAADPPNTVVPIAPQPAAKLEFVFSDVRGEVEYSTGFAIQVQPSGNRTLAPKWEKATSGLSVPYVRDVRTGKEAGAGLERFFEEILRDRVYLDADSEITRTGSSVLVQRGTARMFTEKISSRMINGRVIATISPQSISTLKLSADKTVEVQADRGTVEVQITDRYKVKLTQGHAITVKADGSAPIVREVKPE